MRRSGSGSRCRWIPHRWERSQDRELWLRKLELTATERCQSIERQEADKKDVLEENALTEEKTKNRNGARWKDVLRLGRKASGWVSVWLAGLERGDVYDIDGARLKPHISPSLRIAPDRWANLLRCSGALAESWDPVRRGWDWPLPTQGCRLEVRSTEQSVPSTYGGPLPST